MKLAYRLLPWALLALFTTEIVVILLPKRDRGMAVSEFGSLPALLNGRVQPLDSVARNSLLQIRSTASVPLEEKKFWQFWKHPPKLKATDWLLEVLLKPEQADQRPIFLIHHPELLTQLQLEGRGAERSGLRYYTFNDLQPHLDALGTQGRQAAAVEEKLRTPFQKQVLKLQHALVLYQRIKNSLQPTGTENFAAELADFEKSLGPGVAAWRAREAGAEYDTNLLARFVGPLGRYSDMANFAYPLIAPPSRPDQPRDQWVNAGVALMESIRAGELHPAMKFYASMTDAWQRGQSAQFNQAVADYRAWLTQNRWDREVRKARAEYYFNRVQAFLHSTIIYVCAFVLACGALLMVASAPSLAESLRRSAAWLVALSFGLHTFGLVFRMVLENRPPVTNLYSSAIFIGWGVVVMGLILERLFKFGLGSAVASLAGFITLLIAHNLALGGDTMEMLRAVLDTNFWLATHVVVVTLGYAATFMAGLLAVTYVLLGRLTPLLSMPAGKSDLGKVLSKMVYGIVCFGTLFSFTGTVLGGIWADQSWGRFWGWDPKENGALLIVLWNALILHARWGGLVKDRGIMNLAIFGNIVTAFSWFGVNMLGIGLHSYGFMDAAFKWLMYFNASQVALIALGLMPVHRWKSFRSSSPPPVPTAA
jgi:ABC-type transport system involved in cytochrome c biogenesis permease subunit